MKPDSLQMVTLGYLQSMMAAFLQFYYRTGAGKKRKKKKRKEQMNEQETNVPELLQ